jgi:ribonuclease BN (tRNA processing enzyme)
MKLIFFGTTGAVQTADNTNISFCVIEAPAAILVDASGSPCQYLLRIGVAASDFDALILTHAHPDHMHALPVLIQNLLLKKRQKPLRIICNRTTEIKAKQLLELFFILPGMGTFPIEWVCGGNITFDQIPTMRVALFPVNHSLETSGLKISTASASLVFSSDTAPSERVITEASGATALVHEATGSDRNRIILNEDGHSSALQAGETAEKAGVDTLFLCHFDVRQGLLPEELQREAQMSFKGKVIIPELYRVYEI